MAAIGQSAPARLCRCFSLQSRRFSNGPRTVALNFPAPSSGMRLGRYMVPPSHFQYDVVDARVQVDTDLRDARSISPAPHLDAEGFELRQFATTLQKTNSDQEIVTRYYEEMRSLLQEATGAKHVLVFDHVQRDALAPGGSTGVAEPVHRVHCDYTEDSGRSRVEELLRSGSVYCASRKQVLSATDAQRLLGGHFAIFNVWRTLSEHPLQEQGLAVCDARSVDARDRFFYEVIFPVTHGREEENYALRHNSQQQWYYYSQMAQQDCLIFKLFDNKSDSATCVFHTAFGDHEAQSASTGRHTIEIRAVAFFDSELPANETLHLKRRWKNGKLVGSNFCPHE
eukprot:TRINITY_DN8495_c0_g2_i1.p1 TRINITY_DN8495_c0_g2~~TRINITY_DN8495_c0_g2_i1.p1  ORF type:complete len:353 (+),score=35.23 TRINITY_DN8495_c0_g2_i1:41-1060(+)